MPRATVDAGVAVVGWKQLTAALHRLGGTGEFGVEYELRRRLREAGLMIAETAPGFVTHRTGRHADPAEPRLEDSVRVSVTQNRAVVYSTAIYGGVQDRGGGPKKGWANRGPHVTSGNASRWMRRAVEARRPDTQRVVEDLVDWVVQEFERDL